MSKKSQKAKANLAGIFSAISGDGVDTTAVLPQDTRKVSTAPPAADTQMSVDDMRPDPNQPRRFLTDGLYARLYAGADPFAVLSDWMQRGERDAFVRERVAKLRGLAASIEQRGLIQPVVIRTVENGNRYIVTGERRWWAHVLLAWEERTPKGGNSGTIQVIERNIPADAVRAVQLIENLQRDNLTVVETARGLQNLYDELNNLGRVPWRVIEAELGISDSYRKNIIRVLRLSDDVLSLAEQHQLTEGALRPLIALEKHPDLQLAAIRQLVAWKGDGGYSTARMQAYVAALLEKETGDVGQPSAGFDPTAWAGKFAKRMGGLYKLSSQLAQMDKTQRDALKDMLGKDGEARQAWQELRQQMDDVFGFF